jgi:hypothetical protein
VVKSVDLEFDKILAEWIDSSYFYHREYVNHLPSIVESLLDIAEKKNLERMKKNPAAG